MEKNKDKEIDVLALEIHDKIKGLKMIYNTYTKKRGAPKLLNIFCKKCLAYVMTYQKDGPGKLLRCYLDRIRLPLDLQKRQFEYVKRGKNTSLDCKSCSTIIGTPIIYKPENRPAYHMIYEHFNAINYD
ncbi:hypothetical protein CCPUN_08190 [Cardinium endosymbiont of Culicoides punctatus]|nr:hypothetical protein CCPUN_08190 [Cardinium endosymbiont of Culicoides punctatus]